MAVFSIAYYNKIVEILETAPELQSTVRGICWQVCCAGAGTVVGGAVGGPGGAFVGGTVGAYYGYSTTTNYRSLIDVVRRLEDDERYELQQRVQELVGGVGIDELVSFAQREVGRHLLLDVVKDVARAYQQRSSRQ